MIWPLALLFGVLVTGWMLTTLRETEQVVEQTAAHTPDFFMERFTTTTMGADGLPHRRLAADYMAHFADTESSEFTQPTITLFPTSGPPWEVRSERGWSSANDDVMLLLGKVHIWRDDSDGVRLIEIHTSDLRVLPSTGYGETDQPVEIRRGRTISHGLGMRAYLEDDRLELLSRVRTIHEPLRN